MSEMPREHHQARTTRDPCTQLTVHIPSARFSILLCHPMFTVERLPAYGSHHLCALSSSLLKKDKQRIPLTRTSVPIINVCSVTLHHQSNIKNHTFTSYTLTNNIGNTLKEACSRRQISVLTLRSRICIGRFNMPATHYHRRISKPIADTYITHHG